MNTKILQKCVDELGKEKPDLSYVKGILETLIEMDGTIPAKYLTPGSGAITPMFPGDTGFNNGSDPSRIQTTTAKDLLGKTDELITDEDKDYERKMRGPIAPLG